MGTGRWAIGKGVGGQAGVQGRAGRAAGRGRGVVGVRDPARRAGAGWGWGGQGRAGLLQDLCTSSFSLMASHLSLPPQSMQGMPSRLRLKMSRHR